MSTSKEIRQRAWNSLRDRYWNAFLASLLVGLLTSFSAASFGNSGSFNIKLEGGGFSDYTINIDSVLAVKLLSIFAVILLLAVLVSTAASIFFCNIILVGDKKFFIDNTVEKPNISLIFSGFKSYKRNLKAMLLMDIKIFLWSLVFIIPGIVKAYEYALVPYLLAESQEITVREAFERSAQLMYGNKWRLFKLEFSFIGWKILAVLSFGIGAIFLAPYVSAANAEFYTEIRNSFIQSQNQ